MRGRTRKPPHLRQRRNKQLGDRVLTGGRAVQDGAALPQLPAGSWHDATRSWWASVWASPLAGEYLDADVHGLLVIARLHDACWRGLDAGNVSVALAGELRLWMSLFGLDPASRGKLGWFSSPEAEAPAPTLAKRTSDKSKRKFDPDKVLTMPPRTGA